MKILLVLNHTKAFAELPNSKGYDVDKFVRATASQYDMIIVTCTSIDKGQMNSNGTVTTNNECLIPEGMLGKTSVLHWDTTRGDFYDKLQAELASVTGKVTIVGCDYDACINHCMQVCHKKGIAYLYLPALIYSANMPNDKFENSLYSFYGEHCAGYEAWWVHEFERRRALNEYYHLGEYYSH